NTGEATDKLIKLIGANPNRPTTWSIGTLASSVVSEFEQIVNNKEEITQEQHEQSLIAQQKRLASDLKVVRAEYLRIDAQIQTAKTQKATPAEITLLRQNRLAQTKTLLAIAKQQLAVAQKLNSIAKTNAQQQTPDTAFKKSVKDLEESIARQETVLGPLAQAQVSAEKQQSIATITKLLQTAGLVTALSANKKVLTKSEIQLNELLAKQQTLTALLDILNALQEGTLLSEEAGYSIATIIDVKNDLDKEAKINTFIKAYQQEIKAQKAAQALAAQTPVERAQTRNNENQRKLEENTKAQEKIKAYFVALSQLNENTKKLNTLTAATTKTLLPAEKETIKTDFNAWKTRAQTALTPAEYAKRAQEIDRLLTALGSATTYAEFIVSIFGATEAEQKKGMRAFQLLFHPDKLQNVKNEGVVLSKISSLHDTYGVKDDRSSTIETLKTAVAGYKIELETARKVIGLTGSRTDQEEASLAKQQKQLSAEHKKLEAELKQSQEAIDKAEAAQARIASQPASSVTPPAVAQTPLVVAPAVSTPVLESTEEQAVQELRKAEEKIDDLRNTLFLKASDLQKFNSAIYLNLFNALKEQLRKQTLPADKKISIINSLSQELSTKTFKDFADFKTSFETSSQKLIAEATQTPAQPTQEFVPPIQVERDIARALEGAGLPEI
ncbi:MAG: hypothetical protein Q7K43_02770, partial [Candidatus Woesearchaeota archaeon]|nr:hypothetical protein [Candidatus Woesearchaeota archaeon]